MQEETKTSAATKKAIASIAAATRSLIVLRGSMGKTVGTDELEVNIGPYIAAEIVRARLEESKLSSPYQRSQQLYRELQEIEDAIKERPL